MDALRMEGVCLDYPGRPGVLHDVDLQVPQQSLVILEGRSGSGKSTLLSLAAGLMPPTQGQVSVHGEPMPTDPEKAAALRGERIGLVFQHLNLLGELTVAENMALPLRLRHRPRQERESRVDELLHLFDLGALRDQRPARISGGEQQRVAIARALALRPGLLLVDEPTGSLDRENAATVIKALQAAARSGAGILVATHDPLFQRAGTLYHLQNGRPVRRSP